MKIFQSICFSATVAVAVGISSVAQAIAIRHDVSDKYYRGLGNIYPSVGRVSAPSFYCSGTLIAPRWVLTAAHCVDDLTGFGTFNIGGSLYSIARSRAYQHPLWLRSGKDLEAGVDIALLRLDRRVRNVRPARLFTRGVAEVTRRRRVGTYVGFGNTGTGRTGDKFFSVRRRGARNIINAYGSHYDGWSSRLLLSDFDNPSRSLGLAINPLGSSVPLSLEGSIGSGDSGGGLFINGRLAGVNSFLDSFDRSFNSDYGDIIAATRVTPFFPWIRTVIARGNSLASSSLSLTTDSTTNQLNTNPTTKATSSATAQSIPEPSTVAGLLAIATFFGLVRRDRFSGQRQGRSQ